MAAARYGEMNPVRARLVERAEDWPWSSVRRIWPAATMGWSRSRRCFSRCGGRFADLIAEEADAALVADRLTALAGRDSRPRKRGAKPRREAEAQGGRARL